MVLVHSLHVLLDLQLLVYLELLFQFSVPLLLGYCLQVLLIERTVQFFLVEFNASSAVFKHLVLGYLMLSLRSQIALLVFALLLLILRRADVDFE